MRTPSSLPLTELLRRYRLPMLSALLLNLSFYPWRQEWLIWVACVPLLVWLCDPILTRRQAFNGLLFVGTVYHFTLVAPFLSLAWWGWGTMSGQQLRDYFTYQRLFMAILVAAVSVGGGLALALVGLLVRPHLTKSLVSAWIVPSAWVFVLEYLYHCSVFGFSWGLIGNRLHGYETLRQLASLGGVYGLSFLVMMVNAALASWVMALGDQRRPRRPAQLFGMTAMVLALLTTSWAYGGRALARRITAAPSLRAALLQGARMRYTLDDVTPEGIDRVYAALIDEALSQRPDLMLLPETVWFKTLQLDGTTSPGARDLMSVTHMHQVLSQQLRGTNTLVILGLDAIGAGAIYNTTTFWTLKGLIGVYRKRRLVPFAEYRPALVGRWAPQSRIHTSRFTYTPGVGSQVVRVGETTIGAFICQEVMFPGLVRQTVRDGAQLLVTTGNDGIFTSPTVAWEDANLATLRAVENGRYLLRCMKTGVSAVIDPWGRVLADAPVGDRAIVYGQVQPMTQLTWYTRYGDWIVWLSGGIVLMAALARRRSIFN